MAGATSIPSTWPRMRSWSCAVVGSGDGAMPHPFCASATRSPTEAMNNSSEGWTKKSSSASALGRNDAVTCRYSGRASLNATRPSDVSAHIRARLSSGCSTSQPHDASRRRATRKYPALACVCLTTSAKTTGPEVLVNNSSAPRSHKALTVGAITTPER